MFHLVARTHHRRPAFRTWAEARALWDAVTAAAPGLEALVLMPDHLHLVHPLDVRLRLAAALSGYTRRQNHARGASGSLFEPVPHAEPLVDDDKRRRTVRYVALNPCRARLVADPLAWAFSSHRDAVGLAFDPVRRVHPDPARHHAYISSDPAVHVDGTELPRSDGSVPRPDEVACAVSDYARVPLSALRVRGPARTLYLRAARVACDASPAEIGALVGIEAAAVRRVTPRNDESVRRVLRVVHDPRFGGLLDGDVTRAG